MTPVVPAILPDWGGSTPCHLIEPPSRILEENMRECEKFLVKIAFDGGDDVDAAIAELKRAGYEVHHTQAYGRTLVEAHIDAGPRGPSLDKMRNVIAQGRAFSGECTHRPLAYAVDRDRAEHSKDAVLKRRLVSMFKRFLKPTFVAEINNPAKDP